jgi:hypothetical protein
MSTSSPDWLPKNHEALRDKGAQTFDYISQPANRNRMGFDPMGPQGRWFDIKFMPAFQNFDAAFKIWKNPETHTPIAVKALEEAEKVFKVSFRTLGGSLKSSPLVTAADLEAMGLPARHSGGGTPAPIATEPPDSDVDTSVIGRLGINFFKKGHGHKKGKPAGQHGAEIRWMISDTPPTRWDDLLHSDIDTHTPFTLEFENDQRGKTVYFALRWENTAGKKGPWSEIRSAMIP